MLIAQKDGNKVYAIADGTLFGDAYETETKKGKPCVRFTLQYDSTLVNDKAVYKKVTCVCAGFASVEVAKTLKNREFVFVSGIRTPDTYMTERTGEQQYAIFCTTVLPTKRLMKALAWIEESRQYEKKIYKEVLNVNGSPFEITYDGDEDETIDVGF